jgi:hypothetical protein
MGGANSAVDSKNTTAGKTIRTYLQTAAAVGLLVIGLPEFRDFVLQHYPSLIVYIPLAVAVMTAIQNGFDKDVPNF